jgi:multisubunit Na+/H+ antiporter MnhF subunit
MNEIGWLLDGAILLLVFAIVLCAWRLWEGPSVADRAVALDQIAVIVVAIILLYSMRVEDAVFLDAALVVALIGFLSTLAFARYIERGARP